MSSLKHTLRKLDQDDSRLYEQLRTRPRQHFSQNFKMETFICVTGTAPSKKQAFQRRAKKARFRTPRMTPVPLHRPLTLVGRVAEISTFSLSQSSARAAPTGKHTHVYTASSWVQNWKQNWNSCPFSIFMIKTSFTLFFLKKTTQKSRFSRKTFFQKIDEFLLFLLRKP